MTNADPAPLPGLFEIDLNFDLPAPVQDIEPVLDALFEAGFSDAVVGFGRAGKLGIAVSVEVYPGEGESRTQAALEQLVSAALQALPRGTQVCEPQEGLVEPLEAIAS